MMNYLNQSEVHSHSQKLYLIFSVRSQSVINLDDSLFMTIIFFQVENSRNDQVKEKS